LASPRLIQLFIVPSGTPAPSETSLLNGDAQPQELPSPSTGEEDVQRLGVRPYGGGHPSDWSWGCGGSPYRTGPGLCDDWKVGCRWHVAVDGIVMSRENTDLAALTAATDEDLTRFRREHVGFVFQFYNLIPSLTARENVALVTEIAEEPMRPEEALALVGLEARMDHFPAQLSGGEQQRVAIARAIAKRPEVLLCDEPTGALDSKTGIIVIEALLSVNSQLGTTTVIITHNASIQDVADRVLFFADGQISRMRKNETRRAAAELSW